MQNLLRPYHLIEFRNTKSHVLQVCLVARVKIKKLSLEILSVSFLGIVIIGLMRYSSKYYLMQGRCFICSNF